MWVSLVVTLLMVSDLATAVDNSFLRWKGLLPNKYGYESIVTGTAAPGFTATTSTGGGRSIADYDDTTDTMTTGKEFDWGSWTIDLFGTSLSKITCFDLGYCDDSADGSVVRAPPTSSTFPGTDLYVAPNWVSDGGAGFKYHMYMQLAESVVSGNPGPNQHLREIVSNNVNTATATNSANGVWKCANLLLVTWRFEDATGNSEVAQVAFADGEAGMEDYIIFLYSELTITHTSSVIGEINGITAGNNAAICGASTTDVHLKTNRYCSEPGQYVFSIAVADSCDSGTVCGGTVPEVTNWQNLTPNRGCIAGMVPIVDSCTETAFCHEDFDDSTKVKITLRTRWYADVAVNAQFLDYATLAVVTDPGCSAVLPTSPNRVDTELEQLISLPAAGVLTATKCGMLLTAAAGTIAYAYKVFPSYNLAGAPGGSTVPSIDLSEQYDYIVKGTCSYTDLPVTIGKQVTFGDIASTAIPARLRELELKFELEQNSGKSSVLTGGAVQLGRSLWASICFKPGTPFNLMSDPYGAYVKSCTIADNANFLHDGTTTHSVEVFTSGCRNTAGPTAGQAFFFKGSNAFVHDAAFNADTNGIGPTWEAGEEFCIISGSFDAAKWNHAVGTADDIYMRCSVGFCKNYANYGASKCKDTCTNTLVDRRRRSAVLGDDEEVVQTHIRIVYPDDGESDSTQCVENSVAMATIGSLITAIIVATIGTAVLFVVYHNRKMQLGL